MQITSRTKLSDISIDQVVDLLGLERDPRSRNDTSSFNVRCPFCGDKKYHMNINRNKNCYHCVLCSGDEKNTGVLDLYSRVKFGKPHVPGSNGNGSELLQNLLHDLGNPDTIIRYNNKTPPKREQIPSTKIADDAKLHKAFSALLSFPEFSLSNEHKENLLGRGLDAESIQRNEYRTVPNNYDWIKKYPEVIAIWNNEKLNQERLKFPTLKRISGREVIADLIIGEWLCKKKIDLKGVPGAYKLGTHWAFRLHRGMVVPTRNINGLIVCLQTRKEKGKPKYLTISAKDLPYGVVEDISKLHFPLGNVGPSDKVDVFLTEGPLKADVAQYIYNANSYFIAIQGVHNAKGLSEAFNFLKSCGVNYIYSAFDMDKICNPNVRNSSKVIRRIAHKSGLELKTLCWDTEYAESKYNELKNLCVANNIQFCDHENIFLSTAHMAEELTARKIPYCMDKNYWRSETKGIDDWLNWRRESMIK